MAGTKRFRPWHPDQQYLLPPAPRDWLPEEHLVFFVLDLVESLDLSAIEDVVHAKDSRGTRPYDPRMMVALLLYGYTTGVPSSRRLERATHEDVAFRVLTAEQHPDHTRISEFRRQHLAALEALFVQVLHLCVEAGMVRLGHVALDGTKVQANASKHKAMSYERMVAREAQLTTEVEALLTRAEQIDGQEDARWGKGRRGDELPEELAIRQRRLTKLREAKARLEEGAKFARAQKLRSRAEKAKIEALEADEENLERALKKATDAVVVAQAAERQVQTTQSERDDTSTRSRTVDEMPVHRVKHLASGIPKAKAQLNFTDPESQIMKSGSGFLQGYNGQAAVDDGSQVIVAQGLSHQAPDVEYLRPMVQNIEEMMGRLPRKLSADNGYWSEDNARFCTEVGIDAYIATGRLKHGEAPPPVRGRPPRSLEAKGRMRRKLRTKAGRAVYAKRKAIVEPVFGQCKEGRGFRRFLLRGVSKARSEWSLICTGHNLLKLYRASLAAR
jgi:transposase